MNYRLEAEFKHSYVSASPIPSKRPWWKLGAVGLAVLLAGRDASADHKQPMAWVAADTPMAAEIDDAFSRVMDADPDIGRAVADLESSTDAAGRPWDAAQLLATSYEVVGRYDDARQIRNNHRKKVPQCMYTGQAWPGALADLPASARVLLINEDHLDATTRANLVAALPEFRKLGFTALALEAIPDTFVRDLIKSGEVPDNAKTGTYLRDPISALLVRRAVDLGFHLESYDTDDEPEAREANQAERISAIARRTKGKLVVFTGPGHVQMEGGWMGAHLEKKLGAAMYTIDQTSNVGADCEAGDRPNLTIRERRWSSHLLGMRTDAVLVTPSPPTAGLERSLPKSWLTVGGLRLPISASTEALCPGKPKRCLIEARKNGASIGTVPEDRYLSRGSWRGYLFVTPGRYSIRGVDEKGRGNTVNVTIAP